METSQAKTVQITERLRNIKIGSYTVDHGSHTKHIAVRAICEEAAAEIDRLLQVARSVYEVWAGSEGIPMPETAAEAYLLRLVEQMRDEAKNGLHNADVTGLAPEKGD